MPKRGYHQFCGLARALDVVGERWTLLIVRELLLGPRRYSDFMTELPGITTNLLAKRLAELEAAGIVTREEVRRPAPATLYALTADGAALEPVVMELARWGGRFLDKPLRDDRVDPGWALLSLKRRYRGGHVMIVGVEVGERWFELSLERDYLGVSDREPHRADLLLSTSLPALRALLFSDDPDVASLRASGAVRVSGADGLLAAFLGAFLPPRYAHLPRPA